MSKSLYITATETASGKSAICLGVMQLLLRHVGKAAFFRPIIAGDGDGPDHDTNLMLRNFHLDMDESATHAFTLTQARELIGAGKSDQLMETILDKYTELAKKHDFVLCLGTDFQGKDANFEFDLNAEIAANLGSPMLLVVGGKDKQPEDIIQSARLTVDALDEKSVDVEAIVVNRLETGDANVVV
ncbi:MAG: AAA family ATPase, partial [Proteobacteria bacterium]|nr:AAA family ATPase [Pseudomonadota bacterium]